MTLDITQEDDEDLLNREMDDMFQTSPIRKLSTSVPRIIIESERDEEEEDEDERHLNAKLLENVLEGNEDFEASTMQKLVNICKS